MTKIESFFKQWKTTALFFFIIFFISFFLRIYRLGLIPVFADEAIYIRWAQVMKSEPSLRFLPLSDGKQPLFMWLVIPMLKFVSDPLIAGRLISVFSSFGILTGAFVLSVVLFNSKKAGLLSAFIYALSPLTFFFDRMALVDSLLSMFGIWVLIFIILALRHLSLGLVFLAGFSLGGALITKSPALFFVLLLPSSIFFASFKKNKKIFVLLKALGLLFTALITSFAIYNVLRLGENFHMIGSRNYDYVYPYNHFLKSPLEPFLSNFWRLLQWFFYMGPVSLLILSIAGFAVNFAKFRKEVLVLAVWGFVPILVQAEFARVFTSRYILFCIPFLAVLAGSVLVNLRRLINFYVVYSLVILFLIQTMFFYTLFFKNPALFYWPERDGYLSDWTAGTGIKEVSKLILERRNTNPDRQIVVGTEGYFGTLPDGLQIYLEKEPGIVVIGIGLNITEVPKSLVDSAKAGNITFLLINSSRMNVSRPFEEVGLKVLASYDKAARFDGTKDTLYLFEIM